MTREEFTDRAMQICDSTGIKFRIPSNDEMKLIEYVYMHHPSISNVGGKEQIAYLYVHFGMRIIRDMRNTAHAMEEFEIQERELSVRLNELKEDRESFINGEDVYYL